MMGYHNAELILLHLNLVSQSQGNTSCCKIFKFECRIPALYKSSSKKSAWMEKEKNLECYFTEGINLISVTVLPYKYML